MPRRRENDEPVVKRTRFLDDAARPEEGAAAPGAAPSEGSSSQVDAGEAGAGEPDAGEAGAPKESIGTGEEGKAQPPVPAPGAESAAPAGEQPAADGESEKTKAPLSRLLGKRVRIVALAAAVVVVLLLVLVRVFACGGSAAPDLARIVAGDPARAAKALASCEQAEQAGVRYFASSEEFAAYAADIVREPLPAIEASDMEDPDEEREAPEASKGDWALVVFDEGRVSLGADAVQVGAVPVEADFYLVLGADDLTSADVAKQVSHLVPAERLAVYGEAESSQFYGYFASEADGVCGSVYAAPLADEEGLWLLQVNACNTEAYEGAAYLTAYLDDLYALTPATGVDLYQK